MRETWLTELEDGIDCLFFIGGGGELEGEPDTVVLNCDDSYDHLPAKVLAFFTHALETSDFDWLFKCDDDTYVALDRLRGLISPGHELVGNDFITKRGSPSGGAGYFLSRRVVEALVKDATLSPNGPEDIIIGEGAVKHGAAALASDFLRWDARSYPTPDNQIVTAHWCSPERMRAIHAFLRDSPDRRFHAVHVEWIDEVQFYPSGVFRRKSSGCYGAWAEDESRALALRWFDWGEEVLTHDGTVYRSAKVRMNEIEDVRFQPGLRSIEEVPYLNLRRSKKPLELLYFSPIGRGCLEVSVPTAKLFMRAGADLRLVAYGDEPIRYPGVGIDGPASGGKWQIAKDWIDPDDFEKYDYIFIWDDDLRIGSFDPMRFASIMRMNRLDVAQPAILSPYPLSHEITRPADLPDFGMAGYETVGRLTNFVEVMAPVFSREAWKTFHPFISEANCTGWGYDYFPFNRRGIIDLMTVEHTRPVSSEGNESRNDLRVYLSQHGLLQYAPSVSGYLFGAVEAERLSHRKAESAEPSC
ncbi:MAG: DUF707 domain-containing protein [Verrucomicrobiae bacterium]|nr:DUF707 domain-containing protein [Verrucomicrobiae bacterium]